ncbi:MAG: hypothetical protein ACRD2L_21005, partial [Terriglobia bacterium]
RCCAPAQEEMRMSKAVTKETMMATKSDLQSPRHEAIRPDTRRAFFVNLPIVGDRGAPGGI